jgi:hypothetical protein
MARIDRVPLSAALARLSAGFSRVPVAGRLVRSASDWWLLDQSCQARIEPPADGFNPGDIVGGRLGRSTGDADSLSVLSDIRLLSRRSAPPSEADRDLAGRLPVFEQRADILHAVRGFFR